VATLTRRELTAALAARQLLIERSPLDPVQAIARLTPLQGQHASAPHIALAARLEGFSREALHAAIEAGDVVKTTLMRSTLHLVAAREYPAYAEVARRARLRAWRTAFSHLDEAKVVRELGRWLQRPRTNAEIRDRVWRYEGVEPSAYAPINFARTLLALVQLPPAGFFDDRSRARFVVDPRPLPDPAEAATVVLQRYLAAFGPASRRDLAAWSGVAQREFAEALQRVVTVVHHDERGIELLDLPGAPLPPASTPLPVRLVGRWEQALLAHADRERIMTPEVEALKLTLSGDQTVLVDGRVAASWSLERTAMLARLNVTPHAAISRRARAGIRDEARRTASFCAPDAEKTEVAFA
jgi:hypothetical protein